MKRFISLILSIVIILFVLSKCLQDTRFTKNNPYVPYITVTNTYFDQEISIRYPQVKGLDDHSREKEINELIRNDILDNEIGGVNRKITNRELLDLTLDFEVKMDTTEVLSVLYWEYSTYYTGYPDIRNWSPHGYNFHSITINMKTGQKMQLSDFVNIDMGLIKKVKASENVTNKIVESRRLGYNGDIEKIIDYRKQLREIIQSDKDEDLLKELTDNDVVFCVTKDSLILRFSTGISHARGYNALVEISR